MQEEKAEVRKKQREEQLQQTMEKKKRRPSGRFHIETTIILINV